MDKYAFKREVRKLLKEKDRMDAYVFCWSDWVVHETTAQKYVDSILESHPDKKEPVMNEIKDINF